MELNDVKGALDELSHSMRETIGNIKTDEAHVAELLRGTSTEIRKILTTQ